MSEQIPDGLYDRLITESLARAIAALRHPSCRAIAPVVAEETGERLAESLAKQLTALLDEVKGEGAERAKQQLEIINSLVFTCATKAQPEPKRSMRSPNLRNCSGRFFAPVLSRKCRRPGSQCLGCKRGSEQSFCTVFRLFISVYVETLF